MGVLATFDEEARWAQTRVCDGLVREGLHALGLTWDRRTGVESLQSGEVEFRQLRERFDTRALDRIRLSPETSAWAERRRDWRRLRARGGVVVLGVLEGTLLVYLRTDSGYAGVLCEAGEWLAIPAGHAYALDAGESPDLDALVLSGSAADLAPGEEGDEVPALPSLDAFVETMLEMTGHAADD
ncbi:hypothetical protein QTI33_23580 [Variovorax sp. J22P271]|uniref:hypothetical protein n=1 Tax=Variovorax davisae TaxID=3053515 RepID=UPI002578C128|nr:hypothetical protein [Variovorax sp. J22P271]MDM0035136.1 hypothetical protein [Variovorax sp. J22P271]